MRPSNSRCPVKLWQRVRFNPFYGIKRFDYGYEVEGKITYINYENRWFLAEYISPGGLKQGLSFKFSDVGWNVFKI